MRRVLAFVLAALCCSALAYADGGRLRFSKPAGSFTVTLFTTPEPLTAGPADLSVMVQDTASGEIISDGDIQLRLVGPAGQVLQTAAKSGMAANKLLEAADVNLSGPGTWHLQVSVQQGSRTGVCAAELLVEPGSRKAMIIWIFALMPVVAILLFVLHQRQKSRVRPAAVNSL
jgi:hypothetical protein